MTVHFLRELCHEGQSSWKMLRYGGKAALLVFVDVQIGPVNSGTEEYSVCIPLHSDFILAARIDQPSLFARANFFQQGSDIDIGTDELKVIHEVFPFRAVTIIFSTCFPQGWTGVSHVQHPPRGLFPSDDVAWIATLGLLGGRPP
jgi:hypothetical protein